MINPKLLSPKLPIYFKGRYSLFTFVFLLLATLFLPWIAFTSGSGQLTAINPNERIQTITAPVSGFINNWKINEGDFVKEGQLIAELIDNDPAFMERLEKEKDAAKSALESSKLMMETSSLDLARQKNLYQQGLSAKKEYEKAKIEQSKHSMEYSKNLTLVAKAETQLSRQSSQKVVAPRSGYISRILPGERGQLIKAGSPIAVFTPQVKTHAIEIWIDGNDSSMIFPGQKARVQFEGWPSIQIPGWPSVSVGTFAAKVHLVDNASSYMGKFRVLLVPDGPWPSQKILRLGIHSKANIRLSDSYILKEIWRQLTGFPPVMEPFQDELKQMLSEEKGKEK